MTHAHPTGICAAVLHALALRDALLAENSNGAFFDGVVLFDQLIERMEEIEEELDGFRLVLRTLLKILTIFFIC